MRFVGVDGCRAGWVAVTRTHEQLDYAAFETIDQLARAYQQAELILVDIPIGLPWSDCPIRPCDSLARDLLGTPRRTSVFPVPCRESVHANGNAEARNANIRLINRSLSEQTLGIRKKIAEVDLLVRDRIAPIREIHPEVCFWSLADRHAMQHKKSSEAGRKERVEVLTRFEPQTNQFLSRALNDTLRMHVAADDFLDALAAFITAEAQIGSLSRLSGKPAIDREGLPMEMLYLDV